MRIHSRFFAAAGLTALAACGGDSPTDTTSQGTVQLSAQQATVIKTRIAQLAPVHPELAWLADTIQYVISGGTEIKEAPITGAGTGPFYAVSLQRTITTSFSATAAFDAIFFNDPSNPTDFIIASGWIGTSNDEPPGSVSGTFGAPTANSTVNAHFFHVSGSTVTSWTATAGTASFSMGTGHTGPCDGIADTPTVLCQPVDLNVTFNITNAMPDVPTISSTRAAAISQAAIGGIVIRMQIH
ncbi:MAG TPA: hypothetical protein VE967_00670 [Gemmatimonadaceae bacterium]|nr:hypothetical protein [Gemmatimonadaceae bacterium]